MKTLFCFLLLLIATNAQAQYMSCFLPSSVAGSTCVSAASVVGTIKQTGLTSSMSSTALCTTATCMAGYYTVAGYVIVTTPSTLGSAVLTLTYTDDLGSTSQSSSTISLSGQSRVMINQSLELSGASGITATVTVSGLTGTPTYNVYLAAVELLGF